MRPVGDFFDLYENMIQYMLTHAVYHVMVIVLSCLPGCFRDISKRLARRIHAWYIIFTYIWLICMEKIGKYTVRPMDPSHGLV